MEMFYKSSLQSAALSLALEFNGKSAPQSGLAVLLSRTDLKRQFEALSDPGHKHEPSSRL